MNCLVCGKEIPDDKEYCEECKEDLEIQGAWMLEESGLPIWMG